MKRQKYFSLSQDVEISILKFIWRIKVTSTSAIYLRFCDELKWKPSSCYLRLLSLKTKGCLKIKSDDSGAVKLWCLTEKGFKAIRHTLLALKEEGYASENILHDYHVLAAHYGEWIFSNEAKDVKFVTEQELRRFDSEALPAWATKLQTHKPDALWYFPETKNKYLIGLEVEISRKRNIDYEKLGQFYKYDASLHSVLWVVLTKGHADCIRSAMKIEDNSKENIHNFILIEDFRKHGWNSDIFIGPNKNQSIINFLNLYRFNKSTTIPRQLHYRSCAENILDSHLKSFNSITYNKTQLQTKP